MSSDLFKKYVCIIRQERRLTAEQILHFNQAFGCDEDGTDEARPAEPATGRRPRLTAEEVAELNRAFGIDGDDQGQ